MFASGLAGQTITVRSPANGAVITELTSIKGTTHGARPGDAVQIAISKHESDLEWAESGGRFRWVNGPTGKWYGTLMSADGSNWSAPIAGWTLPRGADLPDGKYLITAKVGGSKQFKSYFTVKRVLPPAAKDGDSVPTPIRTPGNPRRPR